MLTITAAIREAAARHQHDTASPPAAPHHRLSAAAAAASAFTLAAPAAGAGVGAGAGAVVAAAAAAGADTGDAAAMSPRPRIPSQCRRRHHFHFGRAKSLSPPPLSRQAHAPPPTFGPHRPYSSHNSRDPRIKDLGRQIHDDFAQIREKYATPKNPVVLAHGLLGFAELRLAGDWLPGIQYWHGIAEALTANGIEVFTSDVPASGTIEQRATKLAEGIAELAGGRSVNIIAHSMGGLDSRFMISKLQPKNVKVLSLVTVATPHHGSTFADYLFEEIGQDNIPSIYKVVEGVGLETGAFSQLTQKYMKEEFNPNTPDDPDVRYFSYGAMVDKLPFFSPFRHSRKTIDKLEGPNDGLVSVASSQWGEYKGTLLGVNHLDLINWTNRVRWTMRRVFAGKRPNFNAIAFYLHIADMLAKEGL